MRDRQNGSLIMNRSTKKAASRAEIEQIWRRLAKKNDWHEGVVLPSWVKDETSIRDYLPEGATARSLTDAVDLFTELIYG